MLNISNRKINRTIFTTAAVLLAMIISLAAVSAEPVQVQSGSPLGNKDVGKNETAIGDLVADAVRNALRADIALISASELKPKDTPIAEGGVKSSEITALISYPDDPLAVLQIKGSQIRETLEKAVSIYPQPNLGFLQVSGLSFTFEPKKTVGERVSAIRVGGSAIDENGFYTVAVTNSMANGALGYWKIWTRDDVKARFADNSIVKAVEAYLKATLRVNYGSLDRITVVK